MRSLILSVIQLYQWTLSPLLGRCCRFHPSCSCYARESIKRFGVTRGGQLATLRILKCHPWHPGGYDPVPELETPTSTNLSTNQLQ